MTSPVIGLTGGIGSGKSSVARIFEELGAEVVDADQLARQVVAPGEPALKDVVAKQGTPPHFTIRRRQGSTAAARDSPRRGALVRPSR